MIAIQNKILPIITDHKKGIPVGIASVCSAHEYVIKAAITNAKKKNSMLLIESTSNQVDQFGGYTGMTPMNFRDYVHRIAEKENFPSSNIILGGDHLGPNVWQEQKSTIALENAKDQISSYIKANYKKIHLDATMKCSDDGDRNIPLEPKIIAERTALLCKAAEDTLSTINGEIELPVYIIGTDVPPPGGAKKSSESIRITTPEEVEETISITKNEFIKNKLNEAWERVVAVVVQPGVEFGDAEVIDYKRDRASGLTRKINGTNLVYEAHSTDYQSKESLRQMVEDHFAILKVGPWLTFAFREAAFALEMIERELFLNNKSVSLSRLTETIEKRMKQNPKHWNKYYDETNEKNIDLKLKYSFSDRIRYYWKDNEINDSFLRMMKNLSLIEIPVTLLSQFLPGAYEKIRENEILNSAEDIIIDRIVNVLQKYDYAAQGKIKG